VLPLLAGSRFVGRADLRVEDGVLHVMALSVEPGCDPEPVDSALHALMALTGSDRVSHRWERVR
jgi:uncharacterized protein YcaQ